MAERTVGKVTEGKKVEWKAEKLATSGTVNEAKEKLNKVMLDPAAAGGSAFLTGDKKIVCIVKAKSENNENNITVFLYI